ncbi:MAG: membrane protein insertion efficiency factor YidD [Nitrospirae bacterium]|nr:membrane protein insertion efficiency factor YidD [Magnetococcales bacterium]
MIYDHEFSGQIPRMMGRWVLVCGVMMMLLSWDPAFAVENPLALPAVEENRAEKKHSGANGDSVGMRFVFTLFDLYGWVFGAAGGDRCPCQPVCSLYARQAIKKHGVLVGMWMLVDRLIQEHTAVSTGPFVRDQTGRLRVYSPVEANDFWMESPLR